MIISKRLSIFLLVAGLMACNSAAPQVHKLLMETPSLTSALTDTPTARQVPTATLTLTPTFTPTSRPLILAFYGDSVLKVGDTSQEGQSGYSIVDDLRPILPAADQIILSNHGGRKAKWGFENLDQNILAYHPDLVTLWWGLNDLGGCPGIFDPGTNQLLQYEVDAYIADHIKYMRWQIDAMLGEDIQVIVITPIPVLGSLPWSHFNPDNTLVWETDHRCDFNTGLEQLVQNQRQMVSSYIAAGKRVNLVDAWQIYKDHPNSDNMYMDIVHPGSQGAQLIAAQWLAIFTSLKW